MARATPPGQSAIALLRTSGEGSLELAAKVFSRPKALLEAQSRSAIHGWIVDERGTKLDEVIITVYRAPKSFTGEDCAEISCHGGEGTVKIIGEALRKAGFADALPGEFSFRAFMNGKLDLTRAESVMELVSSKTGEAAGRALKRLSGALAKEIGAIKELVLGSLAAAEIVLDYPEEEIDGSPDYRPPAQKAAARLRSLAASYQRERLYRDGALAVIAGRPNAGKSSLFNALLREDRSIVTEIPGTTRDWIEADISIEGIPLRIADTAGLRETAGAGAAGTVDTAEALGVGRSRELASQADVLLYVVDGSAGITGADSSFIAQNAERPLIVIWNKADLAPLPPDMAGSYAGTCAKTGAGIDVLCGKIAEKLREKDDVTEDSSSSPGLGSVRQKDLVLKAVSALDGACQAGEAEFAAPCLREALDALGEITGEVSSADVLEAMFSRFCVGK
jgi:tRNA modification GTPase